ncbi:MAG: MOSC domain-containing protein [Acidimicrobiales bacterium]|nr:MOSC domain-containing protein [Acidimicrobiales bacterium]
MDHDVCEACGFTPDEYAPRDLRTSPGWLTVMLDDMLAPVDAAVLEHPSVDELVGQGLLELSAWAEPCRKNDQWFTGRSDRIDHRRHPGWSRIYAWVLEPGTIHAGDPVTVEP